MTLLFSKKNKISRPALITPQAYVHQFARNLKLPSKAVLCPISPLTKYVENHTRWKKYFCLADIYLLEDKNACYVTGFGSGAPAAAAAAEMLIACGVKEIFFIGLAGSLQEEVLAADLVLCREALCGDGVSACYTRRECVQADKTMFNSWAKTMQEDGKNFHSGTNWTTDALFCETKAEIKHYQKHGVLTVDMETAAIYALAKKRGVRAAAAYAVSDELFRLTWEPHFGDKRIFRQLEILFETALKTRKQDLKSAGKTV